LSNRTGDHTNNPARWLVSFLSFLDVTLEVVEFSHSIDMSNQQNNDSLPPV
jgi:hypothetical protein